MVVLLVTWFVYGQPPASSQTDFGSAEQCELARQAVLLDAERLKKDALAAAAPHKDATGMISFTPNPVYPTVSAVCAAK
jgi:hypothetical protein